MQVYKLTAEPRTGLGKKATKALRNEGKIPVVINSGAKAEHLLVSDEAVRKLIYTPDVYVIELDVNDPQILAVDPRTGVAVGIQNKGEKRMAVIKDLQFHPVSGKLLHMDLLEVTEDKPVVIEIPVKLEGHAEGVKAGGKLNLSMKKVKVKAPYTAIPERVVINVDNLGLGKALAIGDLHFDNFELVNAKNAVVCAVQLTRAARGAAAAAEK